MLLILSARTVTEDIALQFGKLPPAFLPLGSKRLFEYQHELALGEPCYMTVPGDYEISAHDKQRLDELGIILLPQSQSLRLPEAIGNALTRIDMDGHVRILYGDTLVRLSPDDLKAADALAVQQSTTNYTWAFVQNTNDGDITFSDEPPKKLDARRIVCGYYHFSDPELLATACHEDTIVKALTYYNKKKRLTCFEAESWFDFGHLPLYFQSKKNVMIKRVFNDLVFEDHILIKSSEDTSKMRAEAHWFENLPGPLQLHVPRYRGRIERDHKAGYGLEYLYTPLLSDLAVFGGLPLASWLEMIQASFEFIEKCHAVKPPAGSPEASDTFATTFFNDLIVEKTYKRLEQYGDQSGITPDTELTINGEVYPPLGRVAERMIDLIPPTKPEDIRFWHGDFFFGNMFYDFTAQRILAIDPRGQLSSGQLCLWGDRRYDMAKLAHSVVGHYDQILLGRSQLIQDGSSPHKWEFQVEGLPFQDSLTEIFMGYIEEQSGVDASPLLALTSLLFLSMLPLHHDQPERQRHLLAAGLLLTKQAEAST